MRGLLQRIFRGERRAGKPVDYEESKRRLQSPDAAARRELAGSGGVRPEVLYYLAGDADASVRAAVAGNEETPVQADLILARDRDEQVRVDLAGKIARLTPGLSAEQHERLREMTHEVLRILLQDEVVRVRRVIAEVLKDVANVPPDMIRSLARDSEILVAGPVLQYSPVLTDADLLEIIRSLPIPGALASIARRRGVGGEVADAISFGADVDAITALLENPSAQIREDTIDRLVERAPAVTTWHRPLVLRPHLPARAACRLARFVARSLLEVLRERSDLDAATAREVDAVVLRRLESEGNAERDPRTPAPARSGAGRSQLGDALARARALKARRSLGEAELLAALGEDRVFARAALAVLAEMPIEVIDRVLSAHTAKGVTALAWKSGLSMRAALKIQVMLGQIPPAQALKPRDGERYPMSEEAMRWQLEFFGGIGAERAGA